LAHLQGAGLTVWSLASGERIGSIEGIAFDRGSSPGLSPDGRWVAGDASWGTGGYGTNYGVALHDLATKKTANLADLRFVAFSADSQRLVATGDSRMGSRYAVARGIPIVAYTMMDGALVELWRMPRPPNLARLITVTADVRFAILRDVEVTCSGSKRFMQEKGLYVADLLSGESRHLVGYHGRLVLPSRMPAGRLFVWGDEGRELVEWDLASGRRLRSQRVDQVVAAMAFTPDDRWLVLWAGDRVYSWDVEQDRISWAPCQVRSYGAGLQLILAVDGRLCAVLTSGGPARVSADLLVLDVATGRLVATRRIQYGHIAAERSRILVGGLAGEVVVLELTPPGPWFSATG
jgi:hypothetical protein